MTDIEKTIISILIEESENEFKEIESKIGQELSLDLKMALLLMQVTIAKRVASKLLEKENVK